MEFGNLGIMSRESVVSVSVASLIYSAQHKSVECAFCRNIPLCCVEYCQCRPTDELAKQTSSENQ